MIFGAVSYFLMNVPLTVRQRNRIYVWKQDGKADISRRLWRSIAKKLPCYQINVWGAITWFGQGILKILHGTINAEVYINILDEWFMAYSRRKILLRKEFIFQEDNVPIQRQRR